MSDHSGLPIWLVTALKQPQALLVTFQNGATLQYWPERKAFSKSFDFGDVLDPAFWRDNVTTAPLTAANGSTDAAHAEQLPVDALIWAIEWQRLNAHDTSDAFENLRYAMVTLVRWPNLTHLPDALVALVARLCALLEHKPTAVMLMPRVLGTSEQELGYALQLLKRTGHITANTSERERTAASSVTEEAAAAASTAAPEAQSLLGKLWRKLGALTKGG